MLKHRALCVALAEKHKTTRSRSQVTAQNPETLALSPRVPASGPRAVGDVHSLKPLPVQTTGTGT